MNYHNYLILMIDLPLIVVLYEKVEEAVAFVFNIALYYKYNFNLYEVLFNGKVEN